MEAERNGTVPKDMPTKRENFEAFISPRTFQKFKSMEKITNVSKLDSSQNSNVNGSTHQHLEEELYVMKVTEQEYDVLKKKYTKNKKASKPKTEDSHFTRSKSKSPSSLKQNARLDDGGKQEQSTSPRTSSAGSKPNSKKSHTKSTEKATTASRTSLKPESRPVSRKSYDVTDTKTKTEIVGKSRWSVGMVTSKNFHNDKLLDASPSKCNQVSSVLSNYKLGPFSNVDVSDSAQKKRGHQKSSHISKSPNGSQANDDNKDNYNKINSFQKDNKMKTSKLLASKDNTSDEETTRGKNRKSPNTKPHEQMNKNGSSINKKSTNQEQDKFENTCCKGATDHKKQINKTDITQKYQEVTNKLFDTPQNKKGTVIEEKIVSNSSLKKLESQECDMKMDDFLGAAVCEGENGMILLNGKISKDNFQESQGFQNAIIAREVEIIKCVIDCPFITKRIDTDLAPDALQPSVNLDDCLKNSLQDNTSKYEGAPLIDSNDNNFSTMQYEAVAGTSKTIEDNSEQDAQNQQGSPLSVALKLAKKHPPAARTPIMLKTPKRLKDGEIMSEMLIYKLGSHSTPRKIRKNRNLESVCKSDWGTPATDRITSTFLKRSISKKIKGKMFIKKTSKGILHPLPTSKLVPKNSPKRENPKKSAQTDSGVETYKVTPVSDLIKKFENLEKEGESASVQNKVPVTFKKNAIVERWQNGAKNIQQVLHVLKEVKKNVSDSEVQDKETNEAHEEILKSKICSNKYEMIPTSNSSLINNTENFNNLTNLNGANADSIDSMSFVSLKFDEIFSDECADQTGKNMRFSDLYKEINLQLSDSENYEAVEDKAHGNSNKEVKDTEQNNLVSAADSITQDNDDKTIISTNEREQILKDEGNKVLNNLKDNNSVNGNIEKLLSGRSEEFVEDLIIVNKSREENKNQDRNVKKSTESRNSNISKEQMGKIFADEVFTADEAVECQEGDKLENFTQELTDEHPKQSNDDQTMDGVRGFEDVVVAEGKVDTTGIDRASPAYEAGVDDIKDEDFGEINREKLLSLNSPEDDDDTSISTLLALSQKLSKQPTSYADYRKQFMEVKSRSLPPQKINRCDTDSKMSL